MLFYDEQQYCCSRCEPRDTNARVREKGEAGTRASEREKVDLPKSEGIYTSVECARDKDRAKWLFLWSIGGRPYKISSE